MADVFISYAREDLERVRPLVGAIEGAGYSVFWDRKTPAGKTWRQYIGKALDEAKCVIVIWSEYAIKSKFVIEEADDGDEREILVPILIDDVKPPLGFRSIQHEDFREWDGNRDHRRLKSLLASIERITGVLPQTKTESKKEEKIEAPRQSYIRPDEAIQLEGTQEVIINPADSYELVMIPGGGVMMGSPEGEEGRYDAEGPRHRVQVAAFYLGRYPITNAQYQKFLEANPEATEPEYWADRDFNQPGQPVVGVSWEDAQAYAQWSGLRLPTEAEWEYACRAATATRYYTGDDEKDLDQAGWYGDNSEGRLHPVGEKVPNAYGLYDMHGNVWEWVEDDWHGDYEGAPEDGSAWVDNPRGPGRVVRGGCWHFVAGVCRSAARLLHEPGRRRDLLGFRLSRSVTLGP